MIVLKYFLAENKAKEIMRRFSKTPDDRIRATLVKHIGPVAAKGTPDLLNRFLSDKDDRVRANTIEALERLSSKRFIRVFSRFQSDKNNRVRANVIKTLFNLGERVHYSSLKEMLSFYDDPSMRISAVWAIGEIGQADKHCLELLNMVVKDTNEKLHGNLKLVLKKIGVVHELEFLRVKFKDDIKKQIKDKIIRTTELKMYQFKKEKYILIRLLGTITVDTFLSLRLRLQDLESENDNDIVIDFTDVEYVDSSGASLLSNFAKKLDRKGRFLFLFGLSNRVLEIFQLTGIDYLFKIFPTEKQVQETFF